MADFKYEIIEEIGVLSESQKGWRKELNLISWNNGTPKYDIRDWAPGHEKMGKGITLSEEEIRKLVIKIFIADTYIRMYGAEKAKPAFSSLFKPHKMRHGGFI